LFGCLVVWLFVLLSRISAVGADADGFENQVKQEMADSRRNLIFRIFDRVGRARGNQEISKMRVAQFSRLHPTAHPQGAHTVSCQMRSRNCPWKAVSVLNVFMGKRI
jgi:hypothetical protein